MRNKAILPSIRIRVIPFLLAGFLSGSGFVAAQETPPAEPEEPKPTPPPKAEASVGASIGGDGTGRIVVEAHGELPEPAVFYRSEIDHVVTVSAAGRKGEAKFRVSLLQGKAEQLRYRILGADRVTAVTGEGVTAWSILREGKDQRFLEVVLKDPEAGGNREFVVRMESEKLSLPRGSEVSHFAPGGEESAGFQQVVSLVYGAAVVGNVTEVKGFLPLESESGGAPRFQSATGGKLVVGVNRKGSAPGPVELSGFSLEGQLREADGTCRFVLRGEATVREPGASIPILEGRAAISRVPASRNFRLRLVEEKGKPVFRLVFPKAGTFPVSVEFVASTIPSKEGGRQVDFTVAGGAVLPMTLKGFDSDLEFSQVSGAIVPKQQGQDWLGFLPASGHASFAWRRVRQTGQGKLFFTTEARIETRIGAGLMRQDHQIDYRILQGRLGSLEIDLEGEGEILEVTGQNLTGWKVNETGAGRRLEVTLSQPITQAAQLQVRSQTALDAFPVRVDGLRLTPAGAVRHSGYLRLSNLGSVRLEPAGLAGLTQLAPEQFPGDALEARQVFVYRFPAADHAYQVLADRVQPEVGVSQVVRYEITETDRILLADIELDIREAAIREWPMEIPEDYSVVSVTGAGVGDYIVGSEAEGGSRRLNVIFSAEVEGRQLVSVVMEKNEVASPGEWELPVLEFPEARSLRGDIGISGAPGIRVGVGETNLLVEKPLSYFPNPGPTLQQAFRIREPGWTATMEIELLEKSVQADVFHLYSLSEGTASASTVINYFVTGAPVSEWELTVPEDLDNVMVDGKDVRTWRRDGDRLQVSLHQPVIGSYTLLVTSEEKLGREETAQLSAGRVLPEGVQGERGYVQVVSPLQVSVTPSEVSDGLLELEALELPAEFRLLSAAPPLGTWQYTDRPFSLTLDIGWFEAGSTVSQVVEFAEVRSRVSADGELVTDAVYYVKSRGRPVLAVRLPPAARLWEVTVQGRPVTARQSEDLTLVPLPGSADPNLPVEVILRMGTPSEEGKTSNVALPILQAPILKTEWRVTGEEQQILVPVGGNVKPPRPVLMPSGLAGIGKRGIVPFLLVVVLAIAGSLFGRGGKRWRQLVGITLLAVAVVLAGVFAAQSRPTAVQTAPLHFHLPILAPNEAVELQLKSVASWMARLSSWGLLAGIVGFGSWIASWLASDGKRGRLLRAAGIFLLLLGALLQRGGEGLFFGILGAVVLVHWLIPLLVKLFRDRPPPAPRKNDTPEPESGGTAGAASAMFLIGAIAAGMLASGTTARAAEQTLAPDGFVTAESMSQEWELRHEENRLFAKGSVRFSARGGESFVLLKAPAVLVGFEGEGLEIHKRNVPAAGGQVYLVSVPENPFNDGAVFEATFEYQLETGDLTKGVPLLTGTSAVNEVQVRYDQPGWEFTSTSAIRVAAIDAEKEENSAASLLLAPGRDIRVALKPQIRDVLTEETRFYVEASNLYLPAPGVIDGKHGIQVRPSQGVVNRLTIRIPEGITVSEVAGPVSSWEFDAETRALEVAIEPAQSKAFSLVIDTQRGLDPLPTDVDLAPLLVEGASGQVGLIGLAFGPDAQPEKVEAEGMSTVNLGDFDASLLPKNGSVLHRVFRYGAEGGTLSLRAAAVAPEVRVTSRQVMSLGEERLVHSIQFAAEIIRAGLFQLSFPLPEGMEVESISGSALKHFSELTEEGQRQIVLHLNGKTLGVQEFSVTLSGLSPSGEEDWVIPRFVLNEATRQTGELVVKPTTGIRLRTVTRQNVSELDPRQVGGDSAGALAFKLLQGDWSLSLGIEKLDPWITGQLLHGVTIREGQTRATLVGNFRVENASIRSLPIRLPISDPDEIKTLRASGSSISDLVRTAPDSDLWEIQFKRRVVGDFQIRIEFERRGDRPDGLENLAAVEFPTTRQLTYFLGVRASGRLELRTGELPGNWQESEWNGVPGELRDAIGGAGAPAIVLRAITPAFGDAIEVKAQRHSLAEALKLRVAAGNLLTVLSPMGDELTAVELRVEVVQRSNLSVTLPPGGELISVFVNGESVHTVRQGNTWQFYILPGADERTALVRFAYGIGRDKLTRLALAGPRLDVPLENITWRVLAPDGFELAEADGNLEPLAEDAFPTFDRNLYLTTVQGTREQEAKQAATLLEQANQLIQAGDQARARWALSSVANRHALDAASNEDARVQLENLQTQQAIVGLNTRRQRLFLDHTADDGLLAENEQYQLGAAANPVLQEGQLNFRPQELSQLLQGNTNEDNRVLRRLAERLVRQQGSAEPAPQAIRITFPEEGRVYTFGRSVQVAEKAPLDLDLRFERIHRVGSGSVLFVILLLVAFGLAVAWMGQRPVPSGEKEDSAEGGSPAA